MYDKLKQFVELLEDFDTAMLVTETGEGDMTSRPMSLQQPRPDKALWFVALTESSSAQNVQSNGKVNLSFHRTSDHAWVSIAGRAVLNRDRVLIDQLWQKDWDIWFKDGKQTPGIVLIEVQPAQIDFWEPTQGKLGRLWEMAKASFTEGTPEMQPTQTLRVNDTALSGAMRED